MTKQSQIRVRRRARLAAAETRFLLVELIEDARVVEIAGDLAWGEAVERFERAEVILYGFELLHEMMRSMRHSVSWMDCAKCLS